MARPAERLRDFARSMRKSPTRSEDRIWAWLRGRRFDGVKFRRQVPTAGYILDFYCAEARLAIELDGTHHRAAWTKDAEWQRTRMIESLGISILRIPNELLVRDPQLVEQMIRAAIGARR
jgi:very-short-patch-repair endonuclease